MRTWKPLAAFTAVILVLTACTGAADQTPAENPVEIAEAYIEARNAYDVERARELVSDDFRTNEEPPGFVDITGMELAFEQHRAWGFHYSEVDCSLSGKTPEGAAVECDYLWTTELQRIGDHPPTPERLTVFIEDGRIQRIARRGGAFESWWNPFLNFMTSQHPEFRDVVFRSFDLDPESVREVVEQLPQYFDLYEEWLNEPG